MRTTLLVCGVMLLLTFAGCGKSPEEGTLDTLSDISNTLDGVKTKADAEKVKGKLSGLIQDLKDYGDKLKDQGADAVNMETAKEIMSKTMEVVGKMSKVMNIPEVKAVLEAEFDKFKGR